MLQLCLTGEFCRENTLEAPHGFPINISDGNASWKGSVEVIESAFLLAPCLEVVQSTLTARLLPLIDHVIGVLFWALKTAGGEGYTDPLGILFCCNSTT